MSKAKKNVEDVVTVTSAEVICDGGNPIIGHPQVFLHINHDTKQVVCPYCEKRFVMKD